MCSYDEFRHDMAGTCTCAYCRDDPNYHKRRDAAYYICYKVPRLTGDQEHRAGPYSEEIYREQQADIAGYEGVTDVWVDVQYA